MKTTFPYALLFVACLLCSCRRSQTPNSPLTNVTVHIWTATKKLHSDSWFIDGKHVGGGSVAVGYDHFSFTVTRHADSIGYVLQTSPTTSFSDTIHWDPANRPEMSSPADGTLQINGRVSIFKFQERAPDGHIATTRELFVSDAREDAP